MCTAKVVFEIAVIFPYPSVRRVDGPGPVVTLNIEGIDSGDLAAYLDEEYGILTRAGIHCAPLAHESMNSGENGGVRFSFGYFNTEEDINYAINALKNIVSDFKNI